MEKITVIVNPGKKSLSIAKKLENLKGLIYEKTGKDLEIIESSQSGENSIFNLALKVKKRKDKNILIVGGDGSISLASSALAGSQTVLGIIPAGSGNDFTKGLGIPQDFVSSLMVALFGQEAEIDLGLIDGKHIFVNIVGFGLDAKIVKRALKIKKFIFLPKKWLYLIALFCEIFFSFEFQKITATINNDSILKLKKENLIFAVANGLQYGGNFKIAPEASFFDNKLDVCWISKTSKFRILYNFIKVIKGKHIELKEVSFFKAKSVSISSLKEIDCQVDGEVFPSKKDYYISLSSKKLKVRVPPFLFD